MGPSALLPVVPTAGRAYRLLWANRLLHAKAIWPPVVFLVLAEFLYHRMMGTAHGLGEHWQALLAAPVYEPAVAAVAWLAGLKFLLSFSISWRRHLLLGERFDPFFFRAPFWRYLALLIVTYAWLAAAACVGLVAAVAAVAAFDQLPWRWVAAVVGAAALLAMLWGLIRQVPRFTALVLDPPQASWRQSVGAMAGNVWRYAAAWVLAMVPVAGANALLDAGLKLADADPHRIGVALGESAFRQAMLFLHFSLIASVGAITYTTVVDRAARGPVETP